MYERIIEIITFLLKELKQNKKVAEINLDELINLGYTNSEISTAFTWLVDKIEFSSNLFDNTISGQYSFRILHDAEKDLFTAEAWGELIQLHSLNLISNENIEQIIEKALLGGIYKIDLRLLRNIIANQVFNLLNPVSNSNRIFLRGNESIH